MSYRIAVSVAFLLSWIALPTLAQVYEAVEVRGARLIAKEDIITTCGDLTDVVIDTIEQELIARCLIATAAFESVRVRGEGDTLVVEVKEHPAAPGRFDAGLRWDSEFGTTFNVAHQQFNLIPETDLRIQSHFGEDNAAFDITTFRQDMFGDGLHLGVEINGLRSNFADQAYRKRHELYEVYLAYEPNEAVRLDYGFGYRYHRAYDFASDAPQILADEYLKEEGAFTHLAVRLRFGHDASAQKSVLRFEQYLWNVGRESIFTDNRLEAKTSLALTDNDHLLLSARGGMVMGRETYPASSLDRYHLGGASFRGFAPRGLGPAQNGYLLGGTRYVVTALEWQRALGQVAGLNLVGGVFTDIGTLWDLGHSEPTVLEEGAALRSTMGLTMGFEIANLPVSFYLATPLRQELQDRAQVFGLTVSGRF